MSTNSSAIAILSRDVVAEIAPEEMPLFEATSEAYLQNPEQAFDKRHNKEEMLGMGVEVSVTLLTPIVLEVSRCVIKYVMQVSKEPLEKALQDQIQKQAPNAFDRFFSFLQRLFTGAAPAPELAVVEVTALTKEQLIQVQKLALEKAQQFDLSENQASLLADSLVAKLTLM